MALDPNINTLEKAKFEESRNALVSIRVVHPDGVEVTNAQQAAYGEAIIAQNQIIVSGNGVYGFIPANFRGLNSLDGTNSISQNVFRVFSGTSISSYGSLRSFRSVNYKAGQGSLCRFGARFTPAANTWSGIGAFNVGDEYSFGYDGLTFGIWHRYGGIPEVQLLTLTVGATSAGNATLTLNGTVYTIPLTIGTTQKNAKEIANYLTVNEPAVIASQNNNTVIINFNTDGNKTGLFAYTSAVGSVGSLSEYKQGVNKTSVHHPVVNWNGPYDTTWINPELGNTYQIIFQNGYGDIDFYIENPATSRMELVHTIRWANLNTTTNVLNPGLHLGMYATALGTTTGATVDCPFISGFTTGTLNKTRNPRAFSNTKSIDTTETNILTVRCRNNYNGFPNQVEIEPLIATFANDGVKTAIFEVRTGATVAGDPNFLDVGTNLVSEYDLSGTSVTGGVPIATFVVAKGQSLLADLTSLSIRVPPTLAMTISGRVTSGAAADLTASLSWYEDV